MSNLDDWVDRRDIARGRSEDAGRGMHEAAGAEPRDEALIRAHLAWCDLNDRVALDFWYTLTLEELEAARERHVSNALRRLGL